MTAPNNGGIYAVLDSVSEMLIGGLQVHRHEAAAIRTFGDIASLRDSLVALHPKDYQLVRLGWIRPDNSIIPDYAVVMTGEQWAAAQQQNQPSNLELGQ